LKATVRRDIMAKEGRIVVILMILRKIVRIEIIFSGNGESKGNELLLFHGI